MATERDGADIRRDIGKSHRAGVVTTGGAPVGAWCTASCETLRPTPVTWVELAARTRAGEPVAAHAVVTATGDGLDQVAARACLALAGGVASASLVGEGLPRAYPADFADAVARLRGLALDLPAAARDRLAELCDLQGHAAEGRNASAAVTHWSRDKLADMAEAVEPFLETLDPEAVEQAAREGLAPLLKGCWAGWDESFGDARLRRGVALHPNLAWTLADAWRAGRWPRGADPLDVALAEATRTRELPGWAIARFRDAQAAHLVVHGPGPALAAAAALREDPFWAETLRLAELPTNWVPRGPAEWAAFHRLAPLMDVARLAFPDADMARLLSHGGRWARLEGDVARAAGTPDPVRAVRDGADMVNAFIDQVANPAGALSGTETPRRGFDWHASRKATFLGDRSLVAYLRASRHWHANQAGMVAALARLPGSERYPPSWDRLLPDMRRDGVELRVIGDAAGLADEGTRGLDRHGDEGMAHCVASLKGACLANRRRVASVRGADGARLSTVAFDIEDGPRVSQHLGRGNSPPPPEAVAFIEAYVASLATPGALPGEWPEAPELDRATLAAGHDFRRPGNWDAAMRPWRRLLPANLRRASMGEVAAAFLKGPAPRVPPADSHGGDPVAFLRVAAPYGIAWRAGRVHGSWHTEHADTDRTVHKAWLRSGGGQLASRQWEGPDPDAAREVRSATGTCEGVRETGAMDADAGTLVHAACEPAAPDGVSGRMDVSTRLDLTGEWIDGADHGLRRVERLAGRLLATAFPHLSTAEAGDAARLHAGAVRACHARFLATFPREGMTEGQFVADLAHGDRPGDAAAAMARHPHLSSGMAWTFGKRTARRAGRPAHPAMARDHVSACREGDSPGPRDASHWTVRRFHEVQVAVRAHWERHRPSVLACESHARHGTWTDTLRHLSRVPETHAPEGAAEWEACLRMLSSVARVDDAPNWWADPDMARGGWASALAGVERLSGMPVADCLGRLRDRGAAFAGEVVAPTFARLGRERYGIHAGRALSLPETVGVEPTLSARILAARAWREAAPAVRAALDALPCRFPREWDPALPSLASGGLSAMVPSDLAGLAAETRCGPVADGSEGGGARHDSLPATGDAAWRVASVRVEGGGPVDRVATLTMTHDGAGRVTVARAHRRLWWVEPLGPPGLDAFAAEYASSCDGPSRAWEPTTHSPDLEPGYDTGVPGNVEAALELWRPLLPPDRADMTPSDWARLALA